MKTKEELLKFYGVEVGKKYKVYNHVHDWYAKFDGKTFEVCVNTSYDYIFIKFDDGEQCYSEYLPFIKSEDVRYKLNFLDELYYYEDVEVLDTTEKKYLKNIIKPFKNRVSAIIKYKSQTLNMEWLQICITDENIGTTTTKESFSLPNFKAGTMYLGMKADKRYTLAELGLL